MPQLPRWAQGDNNPCAGWQSDGQNGGWSPSFCRPCYEWHQKPFCPTCYSPLGGHCFDAFIMEDQQGSTGMKKINSTKHREEWVRRVNQGLIINVPWDDHTAYDKRPGVILGNPYSNKARKKGLAQAASHQARSPSVSRQAEGSRRRGSSQPPANHPGGSRDRSGSRGSSRRSLSAGSHASSRASYEPLPNFRKGHDNTAGGWGGPKTSAGALGAQPKAGAQAGQGWPHPVARHTPMPVLGCF